MWSNEHLPCLPTGLGQTGRCQTYKHTDLVRIQLSPLIPSPHLPPPPPFTIHRSPVTPFTFLRWLRPIRGFVQIGIFASPELPISSRRHGRVKGRADVEEESQRGEGMREGGGCSQYRLQSYEAYLPPPLSSSLRFTSVLARREPPCSGGVPGYIRDRRAESLNQIYGFRTSEPEDTATSSRQFTCTPERRDEGRKKTCCGDKLKQPR